MKKAEPLTLLFINEQVTSSQKISPSSQEGDKCTSLRDKHPRKVPREQCSAQALRTHSHTNGLHASKELLYFWVRDVNWKK